MRLFSISLVIAVSVASSVTAAGQTLTTQGRNNAPTTVRRDVCVDRIRALRTDIYKDSNVDFASATKKAYCDSSSSKGGGISFEGLSVNPQDHASSACSSSETQISLQEAKTFALSFVPVEALSTIAPLCGVGKGLALHGKLNDDFVTITTEWSPSIAGDDKRPPVRSFLHRGAACKSDDLKNFYAEFQKSGQASIVCSRLQKSAMVFVLVTNGRGSTDPLNYPSVPKELTLAQHILKGDRMELTTDSLSQRSGHLGTIGPHAKYTFFLQGDGWFAQGPVWSPMVFRPDWIEYSCKAYRITCFDQSHQNTFDIWGHDFYFDKDGRVFDDERLSVRVGTLNVQR